VGKTRDIGNAAIRKGGQPSASANCKTTSKKLQWSITKKDIHPFSRPRFFFSSEFHRSVRKGRKRSKKLRPYWALFSSVVREHWVARDAELEFPAKAQEWITKRRIKY